jgi:hypothetical protein
MRVRSRGNRELRSMRWWSAFVAGGRHRQAVETGDIGSMSESFTTTTCCPLDAAIREASGSVSGMQGEIKETLPPAQRRRCG